MILNRHDRITIHGIQYCLPDETSDGYVLRRVEAVDLAVPFTHAELDRLRDRPDWALDEGFFDAARLKGKAAHGAMSMNDLTAKEQGVVLWRWEYCTLYERLRHAGLVDGSDEAMAAAIDIIDESVSKLSCAVMALPARKKLKSGKGKKASTKARAGAVRTVVVRQRPSVSTLRRWLRRLKEFGYFPWSLRDKYQNCGRGAQITGQAYRLLVEHAERYATPERPSYAQLHLDLRAAVKDHNKGLAPESQITCPSKKALRAYIAGMSAFYVFAQREGIEKAKARFAVVTAGPQVVKPYERLELDHWTVNLRSLLTRMGMWDRLPPGVQAELGRMYLCVAIDVATRCIVGACLSRAPSSEDTLAVLEMAVSDKSDIARAASSVTPWDMRAGLTNASVGMDGGSAFANEATRRAIAALGASADYPPGGVPHLRAYVERFFRTVDVGLIARLAGRTFENILARGDADPDAIACITAEDMSWAIVRWIVDAYHNSPHDGLAGETPRNAWLRLTRLYKLASLPDRHIRRHVFGITLRRTLGNRGIRVLGLHYWSQELARYFLDRGEVDLDVKVDPRDLGRISVLVGRHWHTLTCTRAGFDDISVDTWVRVSEDLRRTHADQAKLTEQVVLDAISAIEGRNREAMARAGLALVKASPEQIERAEREVLQAFELPLPANPHAALDRPDPLKGGFPVGGAGHDAPSPPPTTDSFNIEE